jgi:3-oxoacyl-[acyl-carrier protein] reductase
VDLGLEDKCAAVAAGSAGLGLAVARALRAEGVRVAICGRRKDVLDVAAREIGALAVVADLSDAGQARGFVEQAAAGLGRVDILVLNSGGPPPGGFASTTMAAYEAALQGNLLAAIAMCQAAVPAMVGQGWGRIVAITSLSAREPRPGNITTGIARAGLTAFLKALSLEVAARGITVNSLQPGPHDTDRLREVFGDATADAAREIPVGALGHPDDFGQAAAFLCSAQARFITGTSLPVDGGLHRGL